MGSGTVCNFFISTMRGPTLFSLLMIICVGSVCGEIYTFDDGTVLSFAVGINKIFALTGAQLHQMTLDLNLETVKDISNATTSNMLMTLVPFISNGTLIACGSFSCGYCEVIDLDNISRTIHWESISIGSNRNVAFITDHGGQKYLLVSKNRPVDNSECDSDALVHLRNTEDAQRGGIFSKAGSLGYAGIQPTTNREVEFVDGFQLNANREIYLFMNVKKGFENKVQMSMFASRATKEKTFETLQGAVLQCCAGNEEWMLVSSAVIAGTSPMLWAGVFQENEKNSGGTAVAIFDISPPRTAPLSGFCVNREECAQSHAVRDKVLKPAAVVFRYSSITSVAALKSNSWTVLFFGTKTGLLIKLMLDESLKPGCPSMLYSSDEPILPKLLFDPVDFRHVFIASGKQMIKVPVARCGVYQTLMDCWSALDPFCGWCVSQSRCSFQHDCSSSDWVSVPGTSQQRDIMSVHMVRSSTGQNITVTAAPNLNGGVRFSCALEKCDSPGPSNCSCSFSSESFPAEGLSLRVTITVQTETLTKDVLLKNCSSIRGTPTSAFCVECLSAGCVWSFSGDACTWRSASLKNSTSAQDVCQNYTSGQNYSTPEILSLIPDRVSLHGSCYARITGRNLESVTKILFQGLDCNPKESPVLYRSGNSSFVESLTFHIPSGTKGTVRVCLLTPDAQCHGNGKLSYDSQNAPCDLLLDSWFLTLLPHCYKVLLLLAIPLYWLKTKPLASEGEDTPTHSSRRTS